MEKIVTVHGSENQRDWGRVKIEELTATRTVTLEDCGKTFMLNAATEFTTTLPRIAEAKAGWTCRFVVKAAPAGANYVVCENGTYDTNKIVVNGINELEVDTGSDGVYNAGCTNVNFIASTAVAGDWIDIFCDGTNYFVTGQTNADGGITAT